MTTTPPATGLPADLSAYVRETARTSTVPDEVVDPTVTEVALTAATGAGAAARAEVEDNVVAPPVAGSDRPTGRVAAGSAAAVTSVPEPVVGYGAVGVTWEHGVSVPEDEDRAAGAHPDRRRLVGLDGPGVPRRPRPRPGHRGGAARSPGHRRAAGRRRGRRPGQGRTRRPAPCRPACSSRSSTPARPTGRPSSAQRWTPTATDPGTPAATTTPGLPATVATEPGAGDDGSDQISPAEGDVHAEAADLLACPVGRRRADAGQELAALLRGARRLRAPHGQRQRLHPGRGAGDHPQHLRVPHQEPRLVRHRLQLPRRPVRSDLGGPVRRHRPPGRRRAHAQLQRLRLRDVGDRQLRHRPAVQRHGPGVRRALRVEAVAARHQRRVHETGRSVPRTSRRSTATATRRRPRARAGTSTPRSRTSADWPPRHSAAGPGASSSPTSRRHRTPTSSYVARATTRCSSSRRAA